MDTKNVEIERKFKLKYLDGITGLGKGVLIEQCFLSTNPERVVRIRVTSEKEAFLTVKGKAHGATRKEVETPIDPEKAKDMFALREGEMVRKVRRKITYEGKVWELDEFLDENQGLLVAEIELQSETEAFKMPPWVGEELTSDHRYANSSLARAPYKSWSERVNLEEQQTKATQINASCGLKLPTP